MIGLLSVNKSPGRRQIIPDWAVERLQQELKEPEGFPSYGIQTWLQAELGILASYKVVHAAVRYQLKAKWYSSIESESS